MSVAWVALALAQAAPAASPPGDVLFGFYRLLTFKTRADKECGSWADKPSIDQAYDALRDRLVARWGKAPFSPKKPASMGPGDCGLIMAVYRADFRDYSKVAEAALATPNTDTAKD